MPDAITIKLSGISPEAGRAARKLNLCVRQMDLREGSRRWKRWQRVVSRNVAVINREFRLHRRPSAAFVFGPALPR